MWVCVLKNIPLEQRTKFREFQAEFTQQVANLKGVTEREVNCNAFVETATKQTTS